jgi:antitoxin (DNA-binding transcriptional repressor) of toxin-antitoxin stability system
MVMPIVGSMANRTIKASEFKAKCLKLMDEVAASGETITVIKNGWPVVEVRAAQRPLKSLYGRHRGRKRIHGDLDDYEVEWDMQR